MKKSYLFILFSLFSVVAGAQQLLDPTAEGGFELGATFGANGWVTINPATAPVNQWVLGTGTASYGGARAAYISNTSTVYDYTTTTARTSHLYKDISLPAGPGSIAVGFYWKGFGEAGKDRLLVSIAPTTLTPVANIPVSPDTLVGARLWWIQPTFSSTYNYGTFSLGTGAAPSTIRLIFTWQNDGTGGVAPAAAIDNIEVFFTCIAPNAISGIDTVCVGSNVTLTDATPGGSWSSGDLAKATVTSAGVVTGMGAGTVNITYTSACSAYTYRTITVNPLPAAITGPATVCAGMSITLTDATAGGTWDGGTQATATTLSPTTGLITGTGGGNTTVTYTSTSGCRTTKIVSVIPATPILGTLKQCVGGTTFLSHALPGGTWSSSTTTVATIGSSSGSLAALVGGTTTITYSHSCGITTAIDTVVDLTTPIVGNDTVCEGGTTAFAHTYLGGSWSSQYPVVASVLSGSGLVTGVNPGTTTITYTVPPGCYTTKVVTVVAAPPPITGAFQACVNATTVLSNSVGGGTWSSSAPAVATVGATSGVVTGINANTAVITYTAALGCIATQIVTINPLPLPIVGEVNKCPLNPDTLFSPSPGGEWSSLQPGIATIGSTSGIVTTVSGGNATIRYTFPITNCFVSKTIKVHPAPAPIITYDPYTVTFSTYSSGYVSYQWYDALQGLIPGATTYKTAAKYLGNYWVVVTDSNGCVGESNKINFTPSVGFNEAQHTPIRIYPNPSSGIVFVESDKKVRAVISGIEGKSIIDIADAKEIDIANLAAGVYLISVYDENGRKLTVQKLVKQE
jgi:uncharacterized protein YjdB